MTRTAPPPTLPRPPTRPRRSRRGRRLVIALTGLVALGLIWVIGSALIFSSQLERIPGLTNLDPTGSGPVNYLLVGSDSRENLDPELGDRFTASGGQRADVIMLVHTVPGTNTVQMLSLPRDLKVEIPGHGTDRINAAYAFGGPELLVATIRQATGLPVHHYVEIGFSQFADVVDALGGASVSFEYEARDNQSGLSVAAGTDVLDGPAAVAYVRSRTYEEYRDGSWVGVDQNDIGRTRRQQQVLTDLMHRATSPGVIFKLPWLARSLGEAATADPGVSVSDLARLGLALARAGEVEAATLPVRGSTEGGVAYVVRVDPEAAQLLAAFAAGDPLPVPAAP